MYGPHHRVAPLRHTGAGVTKLPRNHCNQGLQRQCSYATNTLQSLPYDTQGATSAAGGGIGSHTMPARMQQPRLSVPSHSHPPPFSQLATQSTPTQLGDGLVSGRSVPNVNYQQPSQQQPQGSMEAATALLAFTQAIQGQERHMATGCQSLLHLRAIAEAQSAQVAAVNALATEVRAMVEATRDVCLLLTRTREQLPETKTSGVHRRESHGPFRPFSRLVLGEECSPHASPVEVASEHSGNENKTNVKTCGWRDGVNDTGAAYISATAGLKSVVLRGAGDGAAAAAASPVENTSQPQYIEDDIFSM
ncbi:uncharacterized protein TEOVI_000082500 [Trypanosoma equiperdum]|uniref:Uncharacterized protein n=2 Tax=Trypanozoon TaxID=39700 RepID=Q57XE7_TRYB2|nr:hypothetical protein, conserved [Trypanosoma brucei brucei TREU927]AAX69747.1 hypothetical protein, conserved [Trypanosoma brucei]AAZ13009.1 hypothetical protein, conserved [Trypanosoma brucei brucei TREU927]SCU69259.1 hypothetical protein, conserved [Trypanosoma equiperdum]